MAPNISDSSSSRRLSATLVSSVGNGSSRRIEFDAGTTAGEVAAMANIAQSDNVARINGQNVGWDAVLPADCRITFAPLKAAGAR